MTRLEAIRARVELAGNDPLYIGKAQEDRAHLLGLVDDLAGVLRERVEMACHSCGWSRRIVAEGVIEHRPIHSAECAAARAALARTEE